MYKICYTYNMSNKIKIFEKKDGTNKIYVVQAFSIKKGNEKLKVPSPFGTETIAFESLDSAISAIKNIGYDYIVCNQNNIQDKEGSPCPDIDYEKIAEVFIKNLGNENLEIRTSSINALAKFGISISDKLIKILSENQNWLVQQSVIKCIEKIIVTDNNAVPLFLDTLITLSETDNNLLKSAVLKTLEQICELKTK